MNLFPLQIRQGLHPSQLQSAARLYFDAFRRQVSPLLGVEARALAFLRQSLNPACALTVQQDGEVIGLVGLRYEGQQFLRLQLPLFIEHFGWLLGRIRFRQASVLDQPIPAGELRIDGIAVQAAMRGRGVGTWLLNAACDFASCRKLQVVRVDVPDTAPGLLQLCLRLGFLPAPAQSSRDLRMFGIQAFTTLVKNT